MATPSWIRKMLQLRGIPFEELHHPEAFTAQEVAQREHFSGHRVAKVVVVIADGKPLELILPASRRVDMARLQALLGVRDVRLATEAEMEQMFTDCEVGAVPPLRHASGVDVLMDESLRVEGDILFQAGTHADAVRLNFQDWYAMVNPRVGSFSLPAEAARL
ncbi:MAG: YbaK/EbsC family protein [Pirellulales bacterium]|nr:YbaK/EbsC family protein [Pirellulales bacterium]